MRVTRSRPIAPQESQPAQRRERRTRPASASVTPPATPVAPDPETASLIHRERDTEGLTEQDRIVQKYKDKVTNRKSAIRAHCVDCMGGYVAEIARCTSNDCALHPFRMGNNPNDKRTLAAAAKRGEVDE